MPTIGLRDVYYALLTTDPIVAPLTPTYAPSVKMAGAISAKVNPNTSSSTLFADDGPSDVAATMGEISLELNLADLALPVQGVLLGHSINADGILIKKGTDIPPWVAIGFKTLKSNGSYRYMWLAKGKFSIPEEDYETKGDSISFKTPTIKGSFVKRDCDDEWERTIDEDDEGFKADYSVGWFTSPIYVAGLAQAAPTGLAGVAPTSAGGVDGTITGTSALMEYKLAAGSTYTACTASPTTVGGAGAYVVRFASKTGYSASPDTAITVPAGV